MRQEKTSRHVVANLVVLALFAASAAALGQGRGAAGVTAFEGARLIVGDGRAPIENATFVVDGARFVQVGRRGDVQGAGRRRARQPRRARPSCLRSSTRTRISARRGTRSPTDLRRRAYYGVGAAMSLGQDARRPAVPGSCRDASPAPPGSAPPAAASRCPSPGAPRSPTGSRRAAEARKAVQELAAQKVDIVKIWVDDRDGKYKKLTPELYGADHRRSAQARAPGDRAHLHARGRQGAAARRHRRVRARRARHGRRRRDSWRSSRRGRTSCVVPNLPDRGVADGSELAGGEHAAPAELQKLQAAATDRPAAQTAFGIQARNLARLNAAGVRIALGTDGNTPWARARSRWPTWWPPG